MNSTGWAVATIARESPEVIRRFVSWHLDLGASAITIYFDDPDDPCIAMLAHLPQVTCIRCTLGFWEELKIAPNRPFPKRQNSTIQHAYGTCLFPWLFICDADELLYSDGIVISEFLEAQPDHVRSIIFRPAERVVVNGSGHANYARLQVTPQVLAGMQPPELAKALQSRNGLVGHCDGKSILRTGIPGLTVRQHFAILPGGERMIDKTMDWAHGVALLHLMSVGYDDWRSKLAWRLSGISMSLGVTALLKPLLESGDETGLRELHEKLFTLGWGAVGMLRQEGALIKVSPDPDHAVARYFPAGETLSHDSES